MFKLFRSPKRQDVQAEPTEGIPVYAPAQEAPPLGEQLAMAQIVELDLAVLDTLPPYVTVEEELPAPGMEWVPRPLVWVEADWALKGFTHVSTRKQIVRTAKHGAQHANSFEYRCALHRLDGTPCDVTLRVRNAPSFLNSFPSASVAFDGSVTAEDHLLHVHDIVAPPRPTRDWTRKLVSDCCFTRACVDCMLAPCCFHARLCALNGFHPRGDLAPSFKRNMACCDQSSPHCFATVALAFTNPPFLMMLSALQRITIAKKHNISESECATCAIVTFCCPCSVVQVHHEIAAAGVWPGYCCFERDPPLPTPAEVQRTFVALTREKVIQSRREPQARAAPTAEDAAMSALARLAMH